MAGFMRRRLGERPRARTRLKGSKPNRLAGHSHSPITTLHPPPACSIFVLSLTFFNGSERNEQ